MKIASGLLALAALIATAPGPASARIRCDRDAQFVRGQALITPYCRDQYLADVARGYGMHVSGDTMRNNLGAKAQVCRFIGNDLRAREACHGYIQHNSWPGPNF